MEEFAEGVSYGADPYRDGVTLTPKRELQALALPSEIMRLPNLNGYLKVPGPYPVTRITLDYVKRPKVAPRFVARRPADGFPRGGESRERKAESTSEAQVSKQGGTGSERPAKAVGPADPPKAGNAASPREPVQAAMAIEEGAAPKEVETAPVDEPMPETVSERDDNAGKSEAPPSESDDETERGDRVNFA